MMRMLSCLNCLINATSLQDRYVVCQNNDERHTYTFGPLYLGIVSRHPENLGRYHLIVVHTLPDFGELGDALCIDSLLHDAFKFIRCWDCTIVTTQPPKLDGSFTLRTCTPICELLKWRNDQNRAERSPVVSPRGSHRCAFQHLQSSRAQA